MPITTGQMMSFLQGDATKKLDGLLKDMQKEAVYPKYMKVWATNRIVETVQAYNNMREAQRIAEGAPYPDLNFQEGWNQKFTQAKFGCRVSVTEEMMYFDRMDIFARLVRQARMALFKAKEIIGTNYLVNADSTTPPIVSGSPLINTVGGDGKAVFATDHYWRGQDTSFTWANITNNSYADLTESGLNAIMLIGALWQDNTTQPLEINLDGIMIPDELRQKAYKLMKSTNEPADNNNAVNSIPELLKGSKTPIVNKRLNASSMGDGNTWFATTDADPESFDLQWISGWDNKTWTGKDDNSQTMIQGMSFTTATGANELRGLIKSKYV